jgi:hypothetical protein
VIHVFPAWPRDWDASFQLAARRGFLVTASMQKGKIDFVEISAGLGGTCRIRNPWPGQIVDLYRNGKKTEQLSGDLLIFQTAKNENIVLTEKDSPVAKSGRIPM